MTLFIWIAPLLLAIFTTLLFNKRTATNSIHENFLLYSIIDIVKTYSFMMIFLSLIINQRFYFPLLFIGLLIGSTLIHLLLNKDQDQDIPVVYETLKNNVVIQMTTIVLFLVFMYIYRDASTSLLAILFSVLSTFVLFVLSYWMKKVPLPLWDYIELKLEMSYHLTKLVAYFSYAFAVSLAIVIFFLTTKAYVQVKIDPENTYYIEKIDRENVFDWNQVMIIDSIITVEDNGLINSTRLLIKDEDNIEYLVVLDYSESILVPGMKYYQLSEENKEDLGNNSRLYISNSNIIPSSSGLYRYVGNDVTIVSGTEDKMTGYIINDGIKFYLVKEDNQSYLLLNTVFETIEIILDQDLEIINNQLFIKDEENYTNYFESTEIFKIVENAVPFYDVSSGTLYQIVYKSDEAIINIAKNETTVEESITINVDDKIIPIFNGILYNHYQFSYQDKTRKLNENLVVFSMKKSNDSYDGFLIYNENEYFVNSDNHTTISVFDKDSLSSELTYELTTYNFVGNETRLRINMINILIRYSIFIALFLFVPITNYEKHSTFDSIFRDND